MKVSDIIRITGFKVISQITDTEREVQGCYISDLLSWVMGHAAAHNVWITIMSHLNIVAVASLLDLACIIVSEGEQPDSDTLARAAEENVIILSADCTSFEAAKKLIDAGLPL